jgi:two-component system chemotaxis response regulator CheY
MRVVIADDSRIPRDILRQILRAGGHTVVGIATDGREAIAECEREKPDMVILDVSMPRLSGDLAAREIIAAGTARHVLIASSMSQDIIFAPLRALGAHTLTKPYRREQLLNEIARVVGEDAAAIGPAVAEVVQGE